jgi:CBS domain-containing protein
MVQHIVAQDRTKGEVIFHQGDTPGSSIYVVREGAVDLYREDDGEQELLDRCDEGKLFGLRSLLAEDTYALTAIAAEKTVIYALPEKIFRNAAKDAPKVLMYIASNFAAGLQWRRMIGAKNEIFFKQDRPASQAFQLLEIQSMERSKTPVVCTPNKSIREAANIMTAKAVGSIIVVDHKGCPVGILTDKDLRKKVATGNESIDSPVSSIMSSPVYTVHHSVTVADVQMEMVRRRISHLCLTEDGSNATPVIGVFTEHDLLIVQGNNPAVFMREIKRARHVPELVNILERADNLLKQYLHQGVAVSYIASLFTEINDTLLKRLIRLAESRLIAEGMSKPEAGFCWLGLGSEGRKERLLHTDQDNALIFEDVPAHRYEETKKYYLRLAQTINDLLHSCGFVYCPGKMMAGNPKWCLSLSEWKLQFSQWIMEPEPMSILHCTVFFDYRPIYGLGLLVRELSAHILKIIEGQQIFFFHLAKSAVENPAPLTFFRDIMVERSGEHKNQFDIKWRAMTPLVDAARVLALHNRIVGISNTGQRFQELAGREPNNKELFEAAADAYQILMRLRTLQGLKNSNSGRYFNPAELSKMERILLRNIFQPIQELQSLMKTRFQLGYF